VDFLRVIVGLHVNGGAQVVEDDGIRDVYPGLPVDPAPGRRLAHWVRVHVEEAFIHRARLIPQLIKVVRRRG
jgi:hypothetical protein